MPSKRSIELLDRITAALFGLTIIFSFCGLFLAPFGQSIQSNLLAVTGIFGLLNYFVGKQRDVGLKDRRILWGLLVYAAMIFVNRLIHGDQYGVMRGLFYVLIFALMMPRKPILLMLGYLAIVLGGMGLGILSIWQYQHGIARVEGFTNAILFSQAALTLVILNWFVFQQERLPGWLRGWGLVGLMAALFALYLSQSRGVWLAFGVILAYVICYKAYFKPWKYVAVAMLCVASIGVIYHTNQLVQSRVHSAVSDLKLVEEGSYDSSWGLRVVAWQSAWLGFLDAPLAGVGTNGFDALKRSQAESGVLSPSILSPELAHAHNQYMQNLVIRGSIGFIALVIFLGLPLYLAANNISRISAGVLVPLAFAINSLSDVPFEHQGVLYLYTLSLVFIWFAHESKKDTCTS
ncbi:polymerase [Aeromonas hydrophila]|uniref:O-antigen ligase family protein n=2 Tax=Aeromonas TaxID=642 RepID=A0AAX3P3W4_AERHY|nr:MULTISPECIES: O-antigen ligase family protein [Aeromonas]GKQ60039.1 O-antigen polymerase [Aeromonas caviae]HDT5862886.1 O-antigen ligase family protein [Aeromonas hydrophila subsp. hydrophila]MCO4115985.1 O-antigen ligase family protein [Aeromonas hydrophila]MCV9384805.1 O-antigen ligase family protein [Aeromonas hydrophila]MDD9226131.1 O-antigen ligase family protein [Aeromonas hydrophila]